MTMSIVPKLNQSFARRIGKSLSQTQKNALEKLLPKYLFDQEKLHNKKINIEIGIGMGEHFVNQVTADSESFFIGFEPYLNGIANTLLALESIGVNNAALWPDDVDLVFGKIYDEAIEKIYILFPDPWPKNKQKKRRIICKERALQFYKKLATNGIINFASDIEDYFQQAQEVFLNAGFAKQEKDDLMPHKNYIQTKYHKKAILENRTPLFATFIKSEI
jgi:release factor glutamine methyltransferase